VIGWLVAVAAGAFETALAVTSSMTSGRPAGDLPVQVALRLAVFAAAGWLVLQLLAGRRWARTVLTVLLSCLGLASLLIGPIEWLAAGHAPSEALHGLTATGALFGTSRVLHVLAVLTATVAMFRPAASGYLRGDRGDEAVGPTGPRG
jgi:hypothetical protein